MKINRGIKATGLFIGMQLFVPFTNSQQNHTNETGAEINQIVPEELFKNVADFGFMWWEDAIFKTRDYTFNIKTNHYALSFNCENLELKGLGIVKSETKETDVLRETQSQSLEGTFPVIFEAAVEADGSRYTATGTPVVKDGKRSYDYYQIVESGKFFHRRYLKNVSYQEGAPARDTDHSGIEIASWPDRLLFMQRIRPDQEISGGVLEISLDLDDTYSEVLQEGPATALLAADGTGYVFLATSGGRLEIDPETAKVSVRSEARNWESGIDKSVGLIVYPVSADVSSALTKAVDTERGSLEISSQQLDPDRQNLNVAYDDMYGWYRVEILDNRKNQEGFARSCVTVKNTAEHERLIRFNFERINNGSLPGASMILRDIDGDPLGIPVQVSKNWHGVSRGNRTERYRGHWLRGLSMMTVPGNSTTTFEIITVNSHWGDLPAISTSQLCLIGWGGNQLWNQSALGNWGETITYDTDRGLNPASLCDMRATFINEGAWGPNLGGAKFFSHYTIPDTEDGIKRTRTHYRRYGPNMAEVTYASSSRDNSMDNEFTAIEYRCDDMARGIYRIRLDVHSDVQFYDYIFFQMGAATYHQGVSNTLARGNKEGLIKEWSAENGGNMYFTPKTEAAGPLPWFSYQDTRDSKANRGFVIRSWKSRINGVDNTPPYWAEHGTAGKPTSIINIVPPPDVDGFKAGDYLEAEIELFMLPTSADGYFGTNSNLKKALLENANTWKMVYREVLGNDIQVKMKTGSLLHTYPIRISSNISGEAHFEVSGGIGHVPLTITGLDDYRNPVLEEYINGSWEVIDQATHGKDFWQTNYFNCSWEITYNIDLDNPGDVKGIREYRFSSNPGHK